MAGPEEQATTWLGAEPRGGPGGGRARSSKERRGRGETGETLEARGALRRAAGREATAGKNEPEKAQVDWCKRLSSTRLLPPVTATVKSARLVMKGKIFYSDLLI